MVRYLIATRDFNGSRTSFRVGDVLIWTGNSTQGFTIYHEGNEEVVPEEYCKPSDGLHENGFHEYGFLG